MYYINKGDSMEKTLEEKMKYHYLSEPIYIVMENIDKYVIPENIRAIEYLWDKNILTTQTNDYFDDFSKFQKKHFQEK